MDIYLPIAGLSVNWLLMVALGGLVGVLSGMFGVGGGFLTTPLLIFYGIPPTVAVASATTHTDLVAAAKEVASGSSWASSSFDLLDGVDVAEDGPDTIPAELYDELFGAIAGGPIEPGASKG